VASSCILEAILPMSHFRIVEVSRPPMSQVSTCCLDGALLNLTICM